MIRSYGPLNCVHNGFLTISTRFTKLQCRQVWNSPKLVNLLFTNLADANRSWSLEVSSTQGLDLNPIGTPRLSCLKPQYCSDGWPSQNLNASALYCFGPPNQSGGSIWVNQIFSTNHVGNLGTDEVLVCFFEVVHSVHLWNDAIVFKFPLIHVMSVS